MIHIHRDLAKKEIINTRLGPACSIRLETRLLTKRRTKLREKKSVMIQRENKNWNKGLCKGIPNFIATMCNTT